MSDLFEDKVFSICLKQERANYRRQQHEQALVEEQQEIAQLAEECTQLQEALEWQQQIEIRQRHEAK